MSKAFNWSRQVPSREGISAVYIAAPDSMSKMGWDITRAELTNSLHTFNKIEDLENKRYRLRTLLLWLAISIPFLAIFYNIFVGVS